jgi:hypothetical protein
MGEENAAEVDPGLVLKLDALGVGIFEEDVLANPYFAGDFHSAESVQVGAE